LADRGALCVAQPASRRAHHRPPGPEGVEAMIRQAIVLLSTVLVGVPWHAAELGHSARSNWSMPQTLVYRDSVAFRGAWTQLFPISSLRPALPAIDFTEYRVLIVASGSRPTGG